MKPTSKNTAKHFVDKMTLPFTGIAGYSAWGGDAPVYQASASSPVTLPSYIHNKWETTVRVKNHMNGEDVINTLSDTWGAWKHGMGKAEIKNHKNEIEALETQYYQSSDKKKIVGYVRNRTFNVATKGIDTPCINSEYNWNIPNEKLPAIVKLRNLEWDNARVGQRLRIDDSYNIWKKYDFDFYSYKSGNWIGEVSKSPALNGTIRIEYPELRTIGSGQINPVIWFVAERRGSSMRPEYNNPKSEKIEENYIKDVVSFRHEDDKEIKIYPNPFQNYFKVKSPSEDNLLLIDIHGRILLELLIANGISKISTETLSKGVYTVVLIKQNAHFKLIKQ